MIDAHVHVWDPRRFSYPWLSDVPVLDRPFLPADIDLETSGVGAIFVQAGCVDEQAVDEARWVSELDWPSLRGIVAGADLRSPSLGEHLDALEAIPGVVGVRHLLPSEDEASWRGDLALGEGLRMLAARGLTFDACLRDTQLDALGELLESVPDLKVVVDHLGNPPVEAGRRSPAGRAWGEAMRRLAERPLTVVKLSGLPPLASDRDALDRNGEAFLDRAVELFGADRAMIGSDWPVSARLGAAIGSADWRDRVLRVAASTQRDGEALDGGTAEAFYGLTPAL